MPRLRRRRPRHTSLTRLCCVWLEGKIDDLAVASKMKESLLSSRLPSAPCEYSIRPRTATDHRSQPRPRAARAHAQHSERACSNQGSLPQNTCRPVHCRLGVGGRRRVRVRRRVRLRAGAWEIHLHVSDLRVDRSLDTPSPFLLACCPRNLLLSAARPQLLSRPCWRVAAAARRHLPAAAGPRHRDVRREGRGSDAVRLPAVIRSGHGQWPHGLCLDVRGGVTWPSRQLSQWRPSNGPT